VSFARTTRLEASALAGVIGQAYRDRGARFAGLFAFPIEDWILLRAVLAWEDRLEVIEAALTPGMRSYPAVTAQVPAASWYEREIHDLVGIEPVGHPELDPLVLPLHGRRDTGEIRVPVTWEEVELDDRALATRARGEGLLTIPYGPVRSGVYEAIEYLVETPGEDIPHVRTRVYHKHRGIQARFEDLSIDDGVLLAERVEGVASVAHALAFCQAVEQLAQVVLPAPAALVRVLHAELERVANHLDSVIHHTEGAGQAVAYARMSLHKERVLRLQARLCGHRFGRGAVVPGGVAGAPRIRPTQALGSLALLERGIRQDANLLMATPSFLDRLRGAGVIDPALAAAHGALGPVGRGSGSADDSRCTRPYGAYAGPLSVDLAVSREEGDALARQYVRLAEVGVSLSLARRALELLGGMDQAEFRVRVPKVDGLALGWAEAPQGEVLYLVEVEDGRVARAKPRSASFHNLALFPSAFGTDIFTDFVFIEASFGLSVAGVSG
jgi:formate hydrogenlyase subunit 5